MSLQKEARIAYSAMFDQCMYSCFVFPEEKVVFECLYEVILNQIRADYNQELVLMSRSNYRTVKEDCSSTRDELRKAIDSLLPLLGHERRLLDSCEHTRKVTVKEIPYSMGLATSCERFDIEQHDAIEMLRNFSKADEMDGSIMELFMSDDWESLGFKLQYNLWMIPLVVLEPVEREKYESTTHQFIGTFFQPFTLAESDSPALWRINVRKGGRGKIQLENQ